MIIRSIGGESSRKRTAGRSGEYAIIAAATSTIITPKLWIVIIIACLPPILLAATTIEPGKPFYAHCTLQSVHTNCVYICNFHHMVPHACTHVALFSTTPADYWKRVNLESEWLNGKNIPIPSYMLWETAWEKKSINLSPSTLSSFNSSINFVIMTAFPENSLSVWYKYTATYIHKVP